MNIVRAVYLAKFAPHEAPACITDASAFELARDIHRHGGTGAQADDGRWTLSVAHGRIGRIRVTFAQQAKDLVWLDLCHERASAPER